MKEHLYYPRYIYWELSNYCNLKCRHCFAETGDNVKTIASKEKIFFVLNAIKERHNVSVRFGGGEPLLVPYIYELTSFCNKKKIRTAITTNGLLLDEKVDRKLFYSGLNELTISVDGLEENHDFVRGGGNYRKILEIIKNILLKSKISISVAFTVTAQNYKEIRKFVEKFYMIGIKKYYFFRYCVNSNAKIFALNSKQLYQATADILYLTEKYKDSKFIFEASSFYPFLERKEKVKEGCNFVKGVMTIKYNGDVVVCAAISKVLGNIFFDGLDEIYAKINLEIHEICEIPKECQRCKYKVGCHGGCKSDSYNVFRSYQYKDNGCFGEKNSL